MTMACNGLAKLSEELGELQQIVGKMLAYGLGEHPDGKGSLLKRFEEEAADVIAALAFVADVHSADKEFIQVRAEEKLNRFEAWHVDPSA